jgi:hypothetical protein
MRKPISGTQAAKMLGLGNNLSFTKKFVETRQIQPIIYPGSKRRLYDPDDVERLIYLNKQRQQEQSSLVNTFVKDAINRHRQAS